MPSKRWPGAVQEPRGEVPGRRGRWLAFRVIVIAAALGLSAWLSVTSVSYLQSRELLEEAHAQIRSIQQSYAELASESDLLATALLRQIEQLEERAAQQEGTIGELTRIESALHHRLEAHGRQLASLSEERDVAQRLLEGMRQGVAEAEARRGAVAEEHAALRERLRAAEARLAAVSGERDASRQAEIGLRWQLALLEDEVARLHSRGEVAQLWLKDWVLGSVEALEDLVDETGGDVERLLARAGSGPAPAQGGPLQVTGPDEVMAAISATDPISGNIHRLAALQRIARTLPLAPPLDQFYVTSPHGKRLDPFTQTWAYHSGVDLGAPRDSKVLATAPGRVVVAGLSGPYGLMVEIDHGLGILTRYGHLASIDVAVGDEVEFRQGLGMVGNTGRSTSRHLHYEILIDDRAFDPARFLNAGRLLVGVFDAPLLADTGG
jgi:murein DD-endopeptidase MepM/ murein hydrolase activator NlpD